MALGRPAADPPPTWQELTRALVAPAPGTTGLGRLWRCRTGAALGSAVFFALAPGVVAGLVPWWLTGWQVRSLPAWWLPLRLAGVVLLVAGTAVLVQAFARFVVEGLGTLTPVAPTRELVVGGLYRFVRNPMYLAVLAAIVGQAMALGQPVLLPYAAVVATAFVAFVHWYGADPGPPVRRPPLPGLPASRARLVAPPPPLEPDSGRPIDSAPPRCYGSLLK